MEPFDVSKKVHPKRCPSSLTSQMRKDSFISTGKMESGSLSLHQSTRRRKHLFLSWHSPVAILSRTSKTRSGQISTTLPQIFKRLNLMDSTQMTTKYRTMVHFTMHARCSEILRRKFSSLRRLCLLVTTLVRWILSSSTESLSQEPEILCRLYPLLRRWISSRKKNMKRESHPR